MNNNNYLGSSFLIVNLDFAFVPLGSKADLKNASKDKDRNQQNENDKKVPLIAKKQSDNRIFSLKNQLGVVKNLDLPPIK